VPIRSDRKAFTDRWTILTFCRCSEQAATPVLSARLVVSTVSHAPALHVRTPRAGGADLTSAQTGHPRPRQDGGGRFAAPCDRLAAARLSPRGAHPSFRMARKGGERPGGRILHRTVRRAGPASIPARVPRSPTGFPG